MDLETAVSLVLAGLASFGGLRLVAPSAPEAAPVISCSCTCHGTSGAVLFLAGVFVGAVLVLVLVGVWLLRWHREPRVIYKPRAVP